MEGEEDEESPQLHTGPGAAEVEVGEPWREEDQKRNGYKFNVTVEIPSDQRLSNKDFSFLPHV